MKNSTSSASAINPVTTEIMIEHVPRLSVAKWPLHFSSSYVPPVIQCYNEKQYEKCQVMLHVTANQHLTVVEKEMGCKGGQS